MRFAKLITALIATVLFARPALAGEIQTNVTFSSYWVTDYKYFHSKNYVKLWGNTGKDAPDHTFVGHFRADFLGPLQKHVDWNHVTPRELMSVRGMSWGRVDFGDGVNGGDNGAWAYLVHRGRYTPLTGVWYLYVDRDLTPGSYPKVQLMPETRPANWYRGFKKSYYQIPFPIMTDDSSRFKIVANTDWLPMGCVFRVTKLGTNTANVPSINDFLVHNNFEVLDIGVSGRGFDVHMGLQDFEPEEIQQHTLWMPGSTQHDTKGATIDILGQFDTKGNFTWWDSHGHPTKVAPPPMTQN